MLNIYTRKRVVKEDLLNNRTNSDNRSNKKPPAPRASSSLTQFLHHLRYYSNSPHAHLFSHLISLARPPETLRRAVEVDLPPFLKPLLVGDPKPECHHPWHHHVWILTRSAPNPNFIHALWLKTSVARTIRRNPPGPTLLQ